MSYWINRGQISMESEYRRRRQSPHRRGPQERENRRGQKAALIAFNIALLIMLFPVAIMGSQKLSTGRARMSLSACFDNSVHTKVPPFLKTRYTGWRHQDALLPLVSGILMKNSKKPI